VVLKPLLMAVIDERLRPDLLRGRGNSIGDLDIDEEGS
jgi:hypothetical protein